MAELGTVFVDVEGDFGKFKKKAKSSFGGIAKMAAKVFIAGFVVKKAFDFGAQFINAAEEYGSLVSGVNTLVGNQQKALGETATLTTDHIVDQADALQKLTGFSNESILTGQRQLLTFQGIQNEGAGVNAIYDRTTGALTDMVASGALSDLNSGAILLGKALNDPAKGMTALSRSGVVFTDEQKAMVASLMESGDTLGAQKVILEELEKVYGGTAESQRDATAVIKNAWQDVQVQVGEFLLPILEKLANWVVDTMIPTLEAWWPTIVMVGEVLKEAFVTAWEVVLPILEGIWEWIAETLIPLFIEWWPVIQETAATIIGSFDDIWATVEPIFTAIVDLFNWVVEIFADNGDQIGTEMEETASWLGEIWAQISEIFTLAAEAITAIIERVTAIIQWIWENFGDQIMRVMEFAWARIQAIVELALGIIKGVLKVITGIMKGDWDQVWEGFKDILTAAWEFIKTGVSDAIGLVVDLVKGIGPKILDAVGALGSLLYSTGKDIIRGLIDGIKNMAGGVVDAIKRFVLDKIPGFVKNFFGISSPSKMFIGFGQALSIGLAEGIMDGAGDIDQAMRRLSVTPDINVAPGIDTSGVRPTLRVTNNFYGPVGGSMKEFADQIATEGARELRFAYG